MQHAYAAKSIIWHTYICAICTVILYTQSYEPTKSSVPCSILLAHSLQHALHRQRLDLEVHIDQVHDEALQILRQVVKHYQ
jgi:hypothetical protein